MDKNEFNKSFGLFVKNKRTQLGWSQNHLASELGNNPQNISRVERGEINPTLYWVNSLSQAYGLTISELIVEYNIFLQNNFLIE